MAAASPLLVTIPELATLLRTTIDEDNDYAKLIVAQASNAVRDEAGQPGWLRTLNPSDTIPEGYGEAPFTARDIASWVAQRAFTDPRNRSRITSGPISDTFFENGVYGLDLTDGEKNRLAAYHPDAGQNTGLWVQPIGAGTRAEPVLLADVRPGSDPLIYADPEWAWAFTPRRA